MKIVGIICEYNPLHLGHRKQIRLVKQHFGGDTAVVCLMSGNYVQRGAPAIFDKSIRAEAALKCGADLVLELPVEYCLSSAEGFASGGVSILSGFCDVLSFGAETGDAASLMATAKALLSGEFRDYLREKLDLGLSFPAARQAALEAMGTDAGLLANPNDILAVEYCKAILSQGSTMEIHPVQRGGDYHAERPDEEDPSATAVRRMIALGEEWSAFVPREAADSFRNAAVHTLEAGERAMLAKLRTMTEAEFETVPFGSEGLWRKLMHAVRQKATLEEILTAVKSKRYTRTRLDRMVMCAFLGLKEDDLNQKPPYVRVLALNDRGRAVLKKAREHGCFLNAGEKPDDPYWERERRIGDLYGLSSLDAPEPPDAEGNRRVYYHRG